ncbi:hypothetical protein [Flavobacterium sp.]|uniref:hypothetical protein n=1 Tax=Flavobacterium sp. TaxID=239 RepID=UPI00261FEF15|nr:hypothetical protein [Flavobacterium sp.]MDD2986664.1 hypothetical protein [Flavobacterium sp.]
MRALLIFLFLTGFSTTAQVIGVPHCGYDFTSYLVLNVHENGKADNIQNLRITIVDSSGAEVINKNNRWSWVNNNKPLLFTPNYKIDSNNKKVAQNATDGKWFFPFAKDYYLLSIVTTFPADQFQVKIEDIDQEENGGHFETQIIQLYPFNMFVLCSSENERQAQQFGPRTNRPVEVILNKKNNH